MQCDVSEAFDHRNAETFEIGARLQTTGVEHGLRTDMPRGHRVVDAVADHEDVGGLDAQRREMAYEELRLLTAGVILRPQPVDPPEDQSEAQLADRHGEP